MDEVASSDQAQKSTDTSSGASDASNRSERGDLTSPTESPGASGKASTPNNESSAAGGMSGGDATSREGTAPVPRSDATDPDPQKAQAGAEQAIEFQREMEGAWGTPTLDDVGKVGEFAHRASETIQEVGQDVSKGLEGNEFLGETPASPLTPIIPESVYEEIKRSVGMGEPNDA